VLDGKLKRSLPSKHLAVHVDCTEDETCFEKNPFGFVELPSKERHLSLATLCCRYRLDVCEVLHLVDLFNRSVPCGGCGQAWVWSKLVWSSMGVERVGVSECVRSCVGVGAGVACSS
jgi:hypothetical protein